MISKNFMDWIMERMGNVNNSEQDNIEAYWNSSDYSEWLRLAHHNSYVQRPSGYWICCCDKNGIVSWEYSNGKKSHD